MIPYGAFAIIFLLAFTLAVAITPLAQRLGKRAGMVAAPGGRRRHEGLIPQTGGIPIFVAFVVAVVAAQFLIAGADEELTAPFFQVHRFDPKEIIRLIGFLIGGTIIFAMGVYDDWKELGPIPIYIIQALAGGISIAFLIIIEYVNNPLTGSETDTFPYFLTVTITLFWLGLMVNTVNWLDGLDGLAAGVAAIACLVLFANAVFRLDPPQHSVALLPVALLGALLGFLIFNFSPAKIFLGAGAYYLGYVLGVLSIIGGAKMAAILLVMGLPLLDVGWQIVRRLSQGKNPIKGDRGHLHFRLLDIGLSQRQIVIGYYLFCAAFGGLALLIPSRLYKLVALIVMGLISLIGFVWLARQGEQPDNKT